MVFVDHWRLNALALSGALVLLLASCNAPGGISQSAPTDLPTSTRAPTNTPRPSATPTQAPAGMAVTGPVETVFDWSRERCAFEDIPDLPARAFRDAAGNVQLISAHLLARRFVGPDLDHLTHDCSVLMASDHQADPALYNDNEWIAAPHTEDGETIYALVHDEFHGWEHGPECQPPNHFPCWFNFVTSAVSTDGGESYHDLATPPDHLVAALPVRYKPEAGPAGIFSPSSIVKKDGYYYAFVKIDEYESDKQDVCLMRTDDLSQPKSWRAWGGQAFDIVFHDPYQMDESELGGLPCAPIDPLHLGTLFESLTYNTYLDRFVMTGTSATHIDGREVWGALYATSDDLIHWDQAQLLFEAELPWTYQPGDGPYLLYATLLDPASESRNFETSGKTGFIYFTRFNRPGVEPLDRDLVRVPVEFFQSVGEADAARVPFEIEGSSN
ncbi:MAG: hypothetical protein WBR18_15565 [Anaerolineales bacterium]